MTLRTVRAVVSIGLLITGWVTSAYASETQRSEGRPRIGLVLSGGGARGSAHVGVLEVLEDLRVPVDVVVGTSMGAIVGGLYSAGVSPDEMEAFLAETNWRDLLDDKPPRRHLPYRRKVEDQTYLMRFEVGFNGGSLQLPPGLISGQKLGFALQELTLGTAGIDDFDRLPIPFRAVATDLETGEAVIFDHGDLATAMRASMSVPGVFSPIEIDGRLLVDGGLVMNLPVDVARAMGADIVIAVDVGAPPLGRNELSSLPGVTSQMLGLSVLRGAGEQAAGADILIRPDLTGYGSSQFERALEMVPRGEAAARSHAAELEELSIGRDAFDGRVRGLRRLRVVGEAKIRSVQLTRSSTADSRFVLRQIKTRPGDLLDLEAVREDVERLYETGDYERIDFHLTRVEDDYILFIEAIDKPWGPNYLRFGLNVTADLEGESSIDVLTSYTMTRLNRRRGELRIHAQLGEHPSLSGELYQPLTLDQTWFAALRMLQSTSTEYLPVGQGAFAPYRTDVVLGGIDLGLQLSHYAEIRIGLDRGTVRSKLREQERPPEVPGEMESDLGAVHFVTVVDQFDNMNFPRHGYFALVDYQRSLESLGSESDYQHLIGFLGGATTHGRHTLLALSNLVSALGTDSPETYQLGGLFKLSGTTPGRIRGQYGGNVSLVYLHRVSDLPIGLGNGVYVGVSVEAGNMWPDSASVDLGKLRYAASLTVGADTILGPLYLAQGFTEGGEQASYLFIGRSF